MARTDQSPGIRPRASMGRRLDIAARHCLPASTIVLPMLLTEAPFNIAGQSALLPAVTLAGVWFWSVHRPASQPPPVVFAIGVLFDLLAYLPIGTGVLILLLVHGIAVRGRRTLSRQTFTVVWTAFAITAVGVAGLTWLLVMLLTLRFISIGPAIFQAIMTAALYPVLTVPLAAAHRSIAGPDQP